jgi:hypothetical protein
MQFSISISSKKVTRVLLLIALLLVLISVLGQLSFYCLPDFRGRDTFVEEFNVDEEANFPSLYSTLLLLLSSILLALVARAKTIAGDRYCRYWKLLSFIFLCLSIDELLSLHEYTTVPLKQIFRLSGFFYHAWVVFGSIFIAIFILLFLRFFLALPAKTKLLVFIAGMLYIGGGLGIEMINGNYASLHGEENLGYELLVTIEEMLEMLGIIIFIHALLVYVKQLDVQELTAQIKFDRDRKITEKI